LEAIGDGVIGWDYPFVDKEPEPMHELVVEPVELWPGRKRLLVRNKQSRQGWDEYAHLCSAAIAIYGIVENVYRYGATNKQKKRIS
jgi:hypothetical protein